MVQDHPAVRPATAADEDWLSDLWERSWGGPTMVTRGRLHAIADLDALIAWRAGGRSGAATYRIDGGEAELISLDAVDRGRGIGSALLAAVERLVAAAGVSRIYLITTNDNLGALRFYQRRGYRIAAIYPGAVDEARARKPSIPREGQDGIPIHDEIELAKTLPISPRPR